MATVASANRVFRDDAIMKKFKKILEKEMSKKEAPRRKVTCFEYGET